jgi:hypothetical protein
LSSPVNVTNGNLIDPPTQKKAALFSKTPTGLVSLAAGHRQLTTDYP